MAIRSWLRWPALFLGLMASGALLGALLWLAGRPQLGLLPSLAAGCLIGLVLAFALAPILLFQSPSEDRPGRFQ